VGGDAAYTIEHLEEYRTSTITFDVNHKKVTCPRFVLVNGKLEPPTYQIQDGDCITVSNYYTVSQLAEFMDVDPDQELEIMVNNRPEGMDAHIYENFSVDWTTKQGERSAGPDWEPETISEPEEESVDEIVPVEEPEAEEVSESEPTEEGEPEDAAASELVEEAESELGENSESEPIAEAQPEPGTVKRTVFVNGELITMQGKKEYVFIDVFDYIDFDLSDSRGRAIITLINDKNALYTQVLNEGDKVVIRWDES
jgi:hypothetical protein